jgi:hypothetical protein
MLPTGNWIHLIDHLGEESNDMSLAAEEQLKRLLPVRDSAEGLALRVSCACRVTALQGPLRGWRSSTTCRGLAGTALHPHTRHSKRDSS